MFEVTVGGWFAAAHQLKFDDGSVEPLHGHNWIVRVTIRGARVGPSGMLVDFTRLRPQLDAVLREMHDRNLNELPAFADRNPSAEFVAVHIAESLSAAAWGGARLACVEVEEAPGCVARYLPGS
ncbi:MAG: 6-carboxytetrahydropterin synthase [Phycisphaerales bacterium]|nr:6-carboxytetrahydropterin synthase [Phycisphaerales bacterium]